jgi:hypothetical protein
MLTQAESKRSLFTGMKDAHKLDIMKKQPWTAPVIITLLVSSLSGCASFEHINACNQLAYSQAPPVYDSRYASTLMQCPWGIGLPGPHLNAMPANPLYCEQLLMREDMNYWSRRSIFDGCMKGVTPTTPMVAPN